MLRSSIFLAALVIGIAIAFSGMLPALDRQLRRFSEASHAFIVRTLTPAKAQTEPIDAKAAADLDEDLDWRIAEQKKTAEGWRAFRAAHPQSAHAPAAETELAKLSPLEKVELPPATATAPAPIEPPPATATAPAPAPAPAAPAPKFAPVVEVANAPPKGAPDYFAALERRPPETKIVETTVVKWREQRTRYIQVHERPRYRRRSPPIPFFLSWFGPRAGRGH
jgi:hypothetical protein